MTLLFFDGFQDAATVTKTEWGGSTGTSVTGRDGSTNGAKAGGNGHSSQLALPSAAATCIVGQAVNPSAVSQTLLSFLISGTVHLVIWLNADGYIEARKTSTSGTIIATSTYRITTFPRWTHLQAKAVIHSTSGSLVVQADGVEIINVSGVSTGTASGSVTHIQHNTNNGGVQFDDLYVCDGVDATATQGRANNDFLGDLKVATLIPTANGDLTAWSKSTGTNAAALVDEIPPNTTDYIFSSTSGQRELMTLPDLPSSAGAVYGLRIGIYGLKSDAGASSVKPLIKESGGTITAQTAKALSTTAGGYYGDFLFTKPSAPTTPFTASDVNALQAGVELA
jgi:hypothetical protein